MSTPTTPSSPSSTSVDAEAVENIHSEHVPQYPAPSKLKQELRICIEEIRRSEQDPVKVYSQIAKIRDCYYNKKTQHYRREIGDLLADCGYASCSYQMLKQLAMRGFFPGGVEKVTNPFLWRTTRFVLDNVWNYSDASPDFAKDLARGKILEVTNAILERYQQKNPDKKSNQYHLLKAALCIMNNLARRPENKHVFKEHKSEKNVFEFKFSHDNFLKVLALTTLAFIVDAKQAQKLTEDNETIQTIVHWMNLAIEKDDFHRLKEGFTAAELAYALDKLAIDGNAEKIIEAKALKCFYRMLCSADEDQQINAAKCVWTLSFNVEARKSIKGYKELVSTLQRMSKEETNKELLQNLNGALWVLFEKGDEIPSTVDQPKHLFISYCWNEKETVRRIWQRLREAGYKVWIDIERMSGDILEAMASAVESSSVVIMCISEGYKQSQCCRTEAGYTYKRKKGFIPLLMQAPYNADGWLGALLSTTLYFDFSSDSEVAFDDSFRNLLRELNNKGVTINTGDSVDMPPDSGDLLTYPRPAPRKNLSLSNSDLAALSISDIDPDVQAFADSLPLAPTSQLDRSPQLHIRRLTTPIQAELSPTAALSPTTSTTTVASSSQSLLSVPRIGGPPESVTRMKKSDVRDWLKENDLEDSIRLLKHVDGKLLWQLKCMKEDAPQFFYQFLQNQLEFPPISLLKFRQALENLK
ncbi:hypothetical protein LOTGIDRAFT_235135 [Lottia gigantea]|uniref:TIR domain-containing protein n=1 Tax=Lottia gigantea TaxID=225164 RepID=V4A0Y4_LOTGI|nr:hypothetical protein LOTGIDRAFT_235135 [Lottia gigantea]ESO86936.1 hypothetical protein LOTGIDRAFT_235135 [Lottia gigantea]